MRIKPGLLTVVIAAVLAAMSLVASAPVHAQSGYDRPGGDYSNFPVRSGDPAACAARCEREGRCRAWSFSYPNTVAPTAMCWLKSQVTTRVAQECCVSGVKGAAVLDKKSDTVEFSMDRTGGDYKNLDVAKDPAGPTSSPPSKGHTPSRAGTTLRPGP